MSEQTPDKYAAQRFAYTPEEQQTIAQSADAAKTKMEIGLSRAQAQLKDWPLMPENTEVSARFPGVDPLGHSSAIDLRFYQREMRVASFLQTRSPEVATYARELLEHRHTHDPRTGVREGNSPVYAEMLKASEGHRQLSRAAKITPDMEVSQSLREKAAALETCNAVVEYDKFLQGVEYAAGVRTGPVPQEVTQLYQQRYAVQLDTEMIARAQAPSRIPNKLQVEFENLDNKLLHQQFANPENWGKSPSDATLAEMTQAQVDKSVEGYARGTAERLIAPLFESAEKSSHGLINRTDLIIVGGKTVSEIMMERFNARNPNGSRIEFETYTKENMVKATSEIVAAGLMSGQRVEAFVPNADGTIPKEPAQITKTGYEPSKLKPVTLNGWERFWAKRGFYKEKMAQAVEYQRTAEARERAQLYNNAAIYERNASGSPAAKELFFGEEIKAHGPLEAQLAAAEAKPIPGKTSVGFSLSRETLVTFATLSMLEQGHKMEDIMDPTKLVAQRHQTAKGLIEKAVNDPDWAAERFAKGGPLLAKEIQRLADANGLTDSAKLLGPESRALHHASRVGFDIYQEVSRFPDKVGAAIAAQSPGVSPKEGYEQLRETMSRLGHLSAAQGDVIRSTAHLVKGGRDRSSVETLLSSAVGMEAGIRQCQQNQKQGHSPWTSVAGEYTMGGRAMAMMDQPFRQTMDRVCADTAYRRQVLQGIRSGDIFRGMKLQVDVKTFAFSAKLEGLPIPGKKAAQLEQLEANVRQNETKTAKKPPAPVKQKPPVGPRH